ncbi:MAG: hypothetical protein IJU16_06145 [Clostridia bacterium]|nr:hypothetical protein [Clostridia bacterium]
MNIEGALKSCKEYSDEKSPYEEKIKTIMGAIAKSDMIPPNPEGWVISYKFSSRCCDTDRLEVNESTKTVIFLTKSGDLEAYNYTTIEKTHIIAQNGCCTDFSSSRHRETPKLFTHHWQCNIDTAMGELDYVFQLYGREKEWRLHSNSYCDFCTRYTEGVVERCGKVKGQKLFELLSRIAVDPLFSKTTEQQKNFEQLKATISKIESEKAAEEQRLQKAEQSAKEHTEKREKYHKAKERINKFYIPCWIAFLAWLAFSIFDAYKSEFNLPFEIWKLSIMVVISACWNYVERVALNFSFAPVIVSSIGLGLYSLYFSTVLAAGDLLLAIGKYYLIILAVFIAITLVSRCIGNAVYRKWESFLK